MLFFTSDTHFDHANILEYQPNTRHFFNIEQMNEYIIEVWNKRISPADTVYFLGDFAFKNHGAFRRRLNGQIVLIPGTHDGMSGADKKQFQIVAPIHEIDAEHEGIKHHIVMCHYALRVWSRSHYGSIHLFGHSHGHLPPMGRSFDVGVDAWNMYPVSLKEVIETANNLAPDRGMDSRYV
jgi:calcineurin-like phosphoesterase family protein